MNVSEAATLPAQGRSRRWYSHPYNRGRYYRLARLVARALPRRGRRALAGVLARVALRILPAERESVRENLRRVLPGVDGRGLDAAVWGTFRNFALCFGDLLTLNRAPVERLSRYLDGVEGEEHLAAASAPGRGLIVATAHLGNWELGGRMLATKWGRATHVVLSGEEDPSVAAFLRRDGNGLRFVTREAPTTSLALLAALRRNEIVAVQGDRATGGRADVWLPFFGAAAAFPLGPFLLARASGAPVLPAFCVLGDGEAYRVFLEAPIWVGTGGEETGLRQLVAVIQRYVSAHPDQWFNFYDFWGAPRG
ncbi:MAG: lysophospholipid acyltransferase family protein [Candidatus Rokuibacteriota bacterium]